MNESPKRRRIDGEQISGGGGSESSTPRVGTAYHCRARRRARDEGTVALRTTCRALTGSAASCSRGRCAGWGANSFPRPSAAPVQRGSRARRARYRDFVRRHPNRYDGMTRAPIDREGLARASSQANEALLAVVRSYGVGRGRASRRARCVRRPPWSRHARGGRLLRWRRRPRRSLRFGCRRRRAATGHARRGAGRAGTAGCGRRLRHPRPTAHRSAPRTRYGCRWARSADTGTSGHRPTRRTSRSVRGGADRPDRGSCRGRGPRPAQGVLHPAGASGIEPEPDVT